MRNLAKKTKTYKVPQILTEGDLTIFLSYADFNTLVTALRNNNYFHYSVGAVRS